ncbi:hypothetical protein [Mesorhizobium sp. B263B2A]|uniref:hypothetical protein n=1 Tax=Mesorhizobium sp. B263B2A TaxID=2876669 RepID=UPI001CD160DF|nr:hypothetical protein [Mesorhizobium sp. B263B2A]MCA0033064.1 hypothetical protein [Mesorhizobium sp. B263B2A]
MRTFALEEEMLRSMTLMRKVYSTLLVSSAVLAASMTSSTAAQDSIRPRMTAAQCQPLTDANYAMCCIAINRGSILSSDQLDQCPPITTSLIATTLSRIGDSNGPGNGGGSSGGGTGGKGGDDGGKGGDDGGKGGDNGGKGGDNGGKSGDNGGKSGDDGGKSGDNGGKSGDDGGKSGDNGGKGGDSGRGSGH